MRMRKSLMKRYNLRARSVERNVEGGTDEIWLQAVPIEAIIWQASGKVQAEIYGERLTYIKNMEYAGEQSIRENDGICVYVDAEHDPDYVVVAINRDVSPMQITLERRLGGR